MESFTLVIIHSLWLRQVELGECPGKVSRKYKGGFGELLRGKKYSLGDRAVGKLGACLKLRRCQRGRILGTGCLGTLPWPRRASGGGGEWVGSDSLALCSPTLSWPTLPRLWGQPCSSSGGNPSEELKGQLWNWKSWPLTSVWPWIRLIPSLSLRVLIYKKWWKICVRGLLQR